MNTEMPLFPEVHPLAQSMNELGHSQIAEYIYNYLNDIKAKTYVIENEYIDKDYLVDFSNFYARSFNIMDKFTTRLHFFSAVLSEKKLKQFLKKPSKKTLEILNDIYLGFSVIKPIPDSKGNPIIGRTLLKPYPIIDNDERRFFVTGLNDISFFGIPLNIESLPFQTQDKAVGACATTACWISSHPLSDLFGIQKYSPFEVTEKSVFFPFPERNFPSEGLSLFQIKNYFNSIGLETEFIDIKKIQKEEEYVPSEDDIVADVARAYTKMGLPIIAALRLVVGNNSEYHVAVISGYRHKHGIIKELYVHDDQIGPYSKVLPDENFSKWINEWITREKFSKVFVEKLVVPIYPKIRLSFAKIYKTFLKKHKRTQQKVESIVEEKLTPRLYLMEIRQYKKFLWENPCENKIDLLCKSFPRFLWIVRYSFHEIPIMDYVYDGTSVFEEELCSITFKY